MESKNAGHDMAIVGDPCNANPHANIHDNVVPTVVCTYGWNSPGRESVLDECHQNVHTLGLLTRSVLIKIAWGFLRLVRNCHWTDDIKKYQ